MSWSKRSIVWPRRRASAPKHDGQGEHNTCGSGLARDGGLRFNSDVDRHTAFASKLAPTRITVFKSLVG
jgi:hypothetical protein